MQVQIRGGVVRIAIFVVSLTCCAAAWAQQAKLEELVTAANSTDEKVQLNAIHALGSEGPVAVPALAKLLKSESPVVRAYAARSLAAIGPGAKDATEGLIELLGDSESAPRRYAIEALKAIRPGPKVSVPLFTKLMHDADPGVRLRVMAAVADAKGAAVPALVEALENDGAAYWACVILRDIGPDAAAAVPALCQKLKDPDPEIRREAVLALATIGSPDAAEQIVPLLKDEHARTAATYALAMLGQMPPDAESIVRANVKSDDELLGVTSMWALALVHPEDMKLKKAVLEHLVALLKNQDPFVRTAAARALASLPPSPEIAGPIFEQAMTDADATTMHYMLDTLAGLGAPAVPRLIDALKFEPLRPQVCAILGRIGPDAAPATEALAKVLSDPNPNASTEAAHALAHIGPDAAAAVPALVAALENEEPGPRHAAVYALGRIGPKAKSADQELLAILRKSDDSQSLLAAWALVRINGTGAKVAEVVMPELLAGLASPDAQVRLAAAETLGELGPHAKGAATALQKTAQDRDERVRDAATKALAAVGG